MPRRKYKSKKENTNKNELNDKSIEESEITNEETIISKETNSRESSENSEENSKLNSENVSEHSEGIKENNNSFENKKGKKPEELNKQKNEEDNSKKNENAEENKSDNNPKLVEEGKDDNRPKKIESMQNFINESAGLIMKENKEIKKEEIEKKEKSKIQENEEKDLEKKELKIENKSAQIELTKENLLESKELEKEELSIQSDTNKLKIRKSILKMQNRAEYYVEKLFKIKNNFLKIKEELNDNFYSLYTSILLFFGFDSYEHLKKSNFFILSSEAWIVEILRNVDDYINSSLIIVKGEEEKYSDSSKEENFKLQFINRSPIRKVLYPTNNDILVSNFPENFTFANILKRIMKIKINEKDYLTNLKILTGSIYYQSKRSATTKLIENNIGKLFLNSLYSTLDNFNFNEGHEDEEIDFKKFENILMQVLLKAIEKTLNLMDNPGIKEDDSGYIKYLKLFEKLKSENKEEIKKKSYKKYYELLDEEFIKISNSNENEEKGKSKNILSEKNLDIFAESFFYFSIYNFEDVINDLSKFIEEYKSLTLRTQARFLRLSGNVYDINKKTFLLFKAISLKSIRKVCKNSKFLKEKIEKYLFEYKEHNPNLIKYLEEKKNSAKESINVYKKWINLNFDNTKDKTLKFWENNLLDKYKYVSEKLVFPLIRFSYKNTNNIGILIYKQTEKCTSNTFYYINNNLKFLLDSNLFVIKKWNKFYRCANEKLKEIKNWDEKSQIKLETNDENPYFVVALNKRFIGNAIKKAFDFNYFVRNEITNFSFNTYKNIKSLPGNLIDFSVNKKNQLKDFVIIKYDEIINTEEDNK